MDCPPHPLKRAAAADGIRHRPIDLGVARIPVRSQECGRSHDHAGLAVAALRNIFRNPGFLTGMAARPGQPFDSGKALPIGLPKRYLTGADSSAAPMYGTRPADSRAAAEFRSSHSEEVAKYPQERHIRRRIYGMLPAVDGDRVHGPLDGASRENVSPRRKSGEPVGRLTTVFGVLP